MVKLTDEQRQVLTKWVEDGATLNDIQTRLKEELSIVLTYFDTRLLVMELGLTIKDKKRDPSEETPAPAPAAGQQATDDSDSYDSSSADPYAKDSGTDDIDDTTFPGSDAGNGGHVSVSLDSLAIPGTMVSGKVTFSDGTSGAWYLDQFGRLGLSDVPPGYQPPESDIPVFQQELQKILR